MSKNLAIIHQSGFYWIVQANNNSKYHVHQNEHGVYLMRLVYSRGEGYGQHLVRRDVQSNTKAYRSIVNTIEQSRKAFTV